MTEVPREQTTGSQRIARMCASLGALGVCWWVSGVGVGLSLHDIEGAFVFFFWSVPVFGVGWVLFGVPVIALGDRILRVPKVLLGVIGAVAGLLVMLLPTGLLWALSHGTEHFKMDWSWLKGWPAFGAGIGAGAMIIYSWLLSRLCRPEKSQEIERSGPSLPTS